MITPGEIEQFRKEANLRCGDLAHLLGLQRREFYRIRNPSARAHRELTEAEEQRLRDVMAGKVSREKSELLPDRARRYPSDMQPRDIKAIFEQVVSIDKVAELTGARAFSVMRWLNGNAAPSGKHLDRLRGLKKR